MTARGGHSRLRSPGVTSIRLRIAHEAYPFHPEQLSDSPVCHLHIRTHPASRRPTIATLSTQALSPERITALHRNSAIQHPMRRPATQLATPNVDVCRLSVMRKFGSGVHEYLTKRFRNTNLIGNYIGRDILH